MTGAGPHNIWAETKGAPFVQVAEDQRGGSNYSLQVMEDYRKKMKLDYLQVLREGIGGDWA